MKAKKRRMLAEWEQQSAVQLTWPHKDTDWAPILPEITAVYEEMAREISQREDLIIVAPEGFVKPVAKCQLVIVKSNDTWARDHGFITVKENSGELILLDFCFNGWGEKFEAKLDNEINGHLYEQGTIKGHYENHLDFVLEGGSIESDGKGTVFTTTCCLMAPHRNQPLTQAEIESRLKDNDGRPYRLLKLPLPRPIYDGEDRLPATYANYLVINGAVLVPTYNQPDLDADALHIIGEAYPDREIIGIDCCAVIKQHGSLHCCTMQYY